MVTIICYLLIAVILIITSVARKSKVSEAKDIMKKYPDGLKEVCGFCSSIYYSTAKRIINNRVRIINAQRDYEEKQKKAAHEKWIKEKAKEIRRSCPYFTEGKSDDYIVNMEATIRRSEQLRNEKVAQEKRIHDEREAQAIKIVLDYPRGAKAVCGPLLPFDLSDAQIDKILANIDAIRNKQKECEVNDAELEKLRPEVDELKRKYPLAVAAVCKENKWSTTNIEHTRQLLSIKAILGSIQKHHEDQLLGDKVKLDDIVKKVKDAQSGYSLRHVRGIYGERIAEKVDGIIKSNEEFQVITSQLDFVVLCQYLFANETRDIIPTLLKDWGYYNYSFAMEYKDDYSNAKSYTLKVWQSFYESCCFDDSVSYKYYPYIKDNRVIKEQFEGSSRVVLPKVWDEVLSFISAIKDKHGDELFVILANTNNLEEYAYHNNFEYVERQLKNANINYGDSFLSDYPTDNGRKYVVIDIVTSNSNLRQYCASLFQYRYKDMIDIIKDSTGVVPQTGVVFISILKCYDGIEVETLNKKKIKEHEDKIKKEKEEAAKKEKDEKDISSARSIANTYPNGFKRFFPTSSTIYLDAVQARAIIGKESSIRDYEQTLSRLTSNVSSWTTVKGIHHYFFYYYYPQRFTDVSPDSQHARKLIYDFKNGKYHSRVKELVVNKIRNTFIATDISKLCFVCIPASTMSVHQSRYEAFSREVCEALGMANAYNYISITKEKDPAHLGGVDVAEYSFDQFFFNGKFVVLFDDVVTRGSSLSSMKANLEALGAVVICAISIGRTYSDWGGNTPQPHPYSGRV